MVFEQLVTAEFEEHAAIPARELHIAHGKRLAADNGYNFAGEGVVERLETTRSGVWLYRLIVPVVAGLGDS
jgi:hypothetical protein